MKFLYVLSLGIFFFTSCSTQIGERKPVPPKGSEESSIPWNAPQQGEGSGALGGAFGQNR